MPAAVICGPFNGIGANTGRRRPVSGSSRVHRGDPRTWGLALQTRPPIARFAFPIFWRGRLERNAS